MSGALESRLASLVTEYDLPAGSDEKLRWLLAAVATAPVSLTSIRDPDRAVDVHVADSLSVLRLPEFAGAQQVVDLGSGGGFPGIPLALARPGATVTLVESVGRKADFLARTAADIGASNVRVVAQRVEEWAEGTGVHDVVCARAVAPLNTLVEYAAPLLRIGGVLIAWKAGAAAAEQADGDAAARALGMERTSVQRVVPFAGSGTRTLYVYKSLSSVPNGYPRRPGMARKRPLTA